MQGTSFFNRVIVIIFQWGMHYEGNAYCEMCIDSPVDVLMCGSINTVLVMFNFLRWKHFASSIAFQLRLDGLSGVTKSLMQGISETKA
jgi:hypothetical protein